jgi:aryl-alcohol dehydrogenase-like predicted oxidoreductase
MLYRRVGKSDLVVSEVGLGTMTWGEQTSEQDAHAMMSLAVDEYGVNFVVRAPSERGGWGGKGTSIESSKTTWSLLGVYVV